MGQDRKVDLLWEETENEIEEDDTTEGSSLQSFWLADSVPSPYIKNRKLIGFKALIHVNRIEDESTDGV